MGQKDHQRRYQTIRPRSFRPSHVPLCLYSVCCSICLRSRILRPLIWLNRTFEVPNLGHDLPSVRPKNKAKVIDKDTLMGAYPDFNGGTDGRQKVDQQNLCLARLPLTCGRYTPGNIAAETVDGFNKNGAIVGVEQAGLRVKYRVQFISVAVMDRVEIGFDCGQ